jgi:ATP-dependent DNA ligase
MLPRILTSGEWGLAFSVPRWLRQDRVVIVGEAVVLGPDGVSDFAALYSRRP